jgi:hypothetical protein
MTKERLVDTRADSSKSRHEELHVGLAWRIVAECRDCGICFFPLSFLLAWDFCTISRRYDKERWISNIPSL